jgi:hypothetical protein
LKSGRRRSRERRRLGLHRGPRRKCGRWPTARGCIPEVRGGGNHRHNDQVRLTLGRCLAGVGVWAASVGGGVELESVCCTAEALLPGSGRTQAGSGVVARAPTIPRDQASARRVAEWRELTARSVRSPPLVVMATERPLIGGGDGAVTDPRAYAAPQRSPLLRGNAPRLPITVRRYAAP